MNKIIIKRLLAYIIDIIIVTTIILFLSFVPFIGQSFKNYSDISLEIEEVQKDYTDEKISSEEYNLKIIDLTYKLNKKGVIYSLTNLTVIISYFVIFQYINNGQTIGKKILNIKVIPEGTNKLTIVSYFIRSLIINNIFSISICLICIAFLNKNIYYTINNGITSIGSILLYSSIIYAFFNKERRTLHDLLTKSKVVEYNKETSETKDNKVIDAIYEEN